MTDELTGDEWTIKSLEPGASKVFTAEYTVTEADAKKGSVVNVATAKGASPDPDKPDVSVKPGEDPEPVEDNPTPTPTPVNPPVLNTTDHFAYIIGNNGMVLPTSNITRAEVATIFFRLLTDESRDSIWSQENDFIDVFADDWYNNAVSTMANGGILKGYTDGTFRPKNSITRAEFATIAIRFFADFVVSDSKFTDTEGHWGEAYINMAAEKGLIKGYPDSTFHPDAPITRAEAMAIINRLLDRHPHKDYLPKGMITWPDNMDTNKWYYADVQEATNSHEYRMVSGNELWTALLPVRDWAAFEKEWSTAHSASNPGEVVDKDLKIDLSDLEPEEGNDDEEPIDNGSDNGNDNGNDNVGPVDGRSNDGAGE